MPPKAKNVTPQVNDYTAKNIQALTQLELIRQRPGMFVGGTDSRALHHLVYEIVDNSVDEALAGRCDHIAITLHDDDMVSVTDNGRGIPIDIHPTEGRPALEIVMTRTGAGGKFDNSAYKVSGGLHGVGAAAVNALSDFTKVNVFRDGYLWEQTYARGLPTSDVVRVRELEPEEPTGTTTYFHPDFDVMDVNSFSFSTLAHRFREMAFVTGGITIALRDERIKPIPREITYYFDGGIASFIKYLNRNRKAIHDVIYTQKDVDFEDKLGKPYTVGVEVAFQYTDAATTAELAFTNTINTPDGGTHLTGLRSALTSVLNRYARKIGALKEKEQNFSGNDTLEGLTAIVSVKHPDPQFESQTKVKLLNQEVQGAVSQVVSEVLQEFMDLNSRDARKIIDKCMTSKRAREAARKARDLVRSGPSLLESSTLPGKLADCSEHGENAEIYIVEGDSAGGCFSGDTKVALADGRNLTFEELVNEQAEGKEHFVYTMRHDGKIGLERGIHARVTKQNAQVNRLTLDNGETITCTPDHRFMLQDGSYKAAVTLTADDMLMTQQTESIHVADSALVYEAVSTAHQSTAVIAEVETQTGYHVIEIDVVAETMDVYDIEVPGTHNFALASGVFVHNSAKQGRDRHFQAILPLRGKILNTERARLDKILDNNEVKSLISALGTGIHDDFNVEKLRYNRVIIMTDADVDGSHIRTLLLTFFFRHMLPLIQEGHLYIAQPPIYLLKEGKKGDYIYPKAGLNDGEILQLALKKYKNPDRIGVQRYKGLGEMNPEQLWETTMDPAHRTLLQVTIEDAASADSIFDMLMGSSVPPRKRFIQTNAKQVKNLDV
jgi:DNA gyrase subunit B